MKTEYLICIDKTMGIATDEESFISALNTQAEIDADSVENTIDFKEKQYSYTLQNKENDKNVFYHLVINFTDVVPFDIENEDIKIYRQLLSKIELVFRQLKFKAEIIWDDINYQCSQLAYPKIYEIENLFRKLITKFMLYNVGAEWENIFTPNDIAKGLSTDKASSREGGLMYKLDFIQINDYLFGEKAKIVDIKKLKDYKDREDIKFSEVEDFIPKTNWDRFFKGKIQIDDKQMKKNWDELYQYRNKIAHNNSFTPDDLKRINDLIAIIKEPIEKAIEELDKIELEEDELPLLQTIDSVFDNIVILLDELYWIFASYVLNRVLKKEPMDIDRFNYFYFSKYSNLTDNLELQPLKLLLEVRKTHSIPMNSSLEEVKQAFEYVLTNHYEYWIDKINTRPDSNIKITRGGEEEEVETEENQQRL